MMMSGKAPEPIVSAPLSIEVRRAHHRRVYLEEMENTKAFLPVLRREIAQYQEYAKKHREKRPDLALAYDGLIISTLELLEVEIAYMRRIRENWESGKTIQGGEI